MSLYIIRKNAPTVMTKKVGAGKRYASFCLDHPMIFEKRELLEVSSDEYHFAGRDGKEWYFAANDVRMV